MTGGPGVTVEGLTKRFGPVHAVEDLSFRAEPGRVTGFLGPNGAGKTTTLRMVVGLVRPTAGRATIGGTEYDHLAHPLRVVGAALDSGGFHPGRTARDHLRVHVLQAGLPRDRVDTALEQVGLTDAADRRVGGFSLGMRQRLGLATALVGDPQVLLLDEPANGLDPEGIAWLRGFLRWLAEQGRTVLVSSHLLAEMAQVADDVVIIDQGRLVRAEPLAQLLGGAAALVRVRSPQLADLQVALATEGLAAQVEDGPVPTLVVTGTSAATVGDLATRAGVTLHHLSEQQPDLEDVFLQLVRDGRSGA